MPVFVDLRQLKFFTLIDAQYKEGSEIFSGHSYAFNLLVQMFRTILEGYGEIRGLEKYATDYSLGPMTQWRVKRQVRALKEYLKVGGDSVLAVERESITIGLTQLE